MRWIRAFAHLVVFGLMMTGPVLAQVGSSGLAVEVPVLEDAPDSSLLCQGAEGFLLCVADFDPGVYGVVTGDPAISVENQSLENTVLAVTEGNVVIRVSAAAGDIEVGDLLTSSEIPGVVVKATKNGFVVGTALEPWSGEGEGQILVALNIHPTFALSDARTDLLDSLRKGISFSLISPLASLRFLLAFAIAAVSFGFGLWYFGRQARTGVEAIGRNPLAKKTIQTSMLVSLALGLAVIVGGLVVAAGILIF